MNTVLSTKNQNSLFITDEQGKYPSIAFNLNKEEQCVEILLADDEGTVKVFELNTAESLKAVSDFSGLALLKLLECGLK